MTHPRIVPRTRTGGEVTQVIDLSVIHAIVYVAPADHERWVEPELARSHATVQVASGVADIVFALGEGSGPRPQLLVIDLDLLSGGELFHLHQIRDLGWCGTLIALGNVPPSLRASLKISRVFPRPFLDNALRIAVSEHRSAMELRTQLLPVTR